MSLGDEIEVRIAGNLCRPVTVVRHGGTTFASTIIAASPVALVGGRMDSPPVTLLLEVHGAANAASFAARAGVGSRVILRGTLEQRPVIGTMERTTACENETAAVRDTHRALVLIVERLLYVAPPASYLQEADDALEN